MKKSFNLGINILFFSIIFWFIYTVVFLFIDGWHLKATNPYEILLDGIFSIAWFIGILFIISSGIEIIKYCIGMKDQIDAILKQGNSILDNNHEYMEKEMKILEAFNDILIEIKSKSEKKSSPKKSKPKAEDNKAPEAE